MCLELGAALYKAVCLLGAKGLRVMCREEGFRYIFYTTNLERKPLRIEVKDVLYKRLFFNWGYWITAITCLGLCDASVYSVAD